MRHFGGKRGTSPGYCQVELEIRVLLPPLTSREGGVPCPSRMEVGIQPSTGSGRDALLPPGGLKVSAPHSTFAAGCAWGSHSGGVWLEKNSYFLNVFLPR